MEFEVLPTDDNLDRSILTDCVERNKYLFEFYNMLNSDANIGVKTVALDGNWGSGKTFFVKSTMLLMNEKSKRKLSEKIENLLKNSADEQARNLKKQITELPDCNVCPFYYDAWIHDSDQYPTLSILNALCEDKNCLPNTVGVKDIISSLPDVLRPILGEVSFISSFYKIRDAISKVIDNLQENKYNDLLSSVKNIKNTPELHSCFYISLNNEINSCMLCRGHLDYKELQIASIENIDKDNVEHLYDKIVSHQNNLLERMYEGDVPEFCKGCYHLRVKNVDKVYKFLEPIRYISLCGSKYCNLRCEHCFFIRDNEDIKDTDISKVINFLGLLKSKGFLSEFKALRLANGEPSIIKDDIKLADYCVENSIPVEIYTNGAKVPQTFVDGVNKGLFRIILSPDAGSREVYKKIKGKDYFETTWFNIKKYVEETSGNVEVKFILEKGNIDDVDNMINMCLKTGVNKVHLSMDVNISETEFYKYESSFSHFVNRCKNEGINLLSIFTFVPEQIKNKVSNLSTE